MGEATSFGEQLRRFRELAGLSQEELAEQAGLTVQAIGMLERGERRSPYPHTVRALAEGLGLDATARAALIAALPRRARRGTTDLAVPPTSADRPVAVTVHADAAPAPAAPRWEPRSWFPQTKLRPPRPGEANLPRPHLLDQARAVVLGHRLTLASAPAGSGKTTLLAALPVALPDLPIAWLALDTDDNDPTTFASVLTLALRAALPTLGAATEALLASLPEPGAQLRRLMGTLINDLIAAPVGPLVLVLDDLHAISDSAIHDALDYLIERLPDDVHVVAATRYDPPLALARLRARGQLGELRLSDLRFTPAETGQLLNDRLALGMPDGEVLTLHGRVGGWAAGLRLLALMLGRLPTVEERCAFVARLGEDGRYLFDFLAEEVLGQQEPELQRFLLDTAILPELTPDLCRAVTGRDDAAHLLDQAYRRNLFLTLSGGPVAETGTTFRFHDLFAEFLRKRQLADPPGRIRELHRRAGDAEPDPARAIAHYCAAERWEDAARAIKTSAPDFARHGLYRRLHDWIMALPADVREAQPRLLHLLGLYAFHTGDWAAARPLLERAETGLAARGDHAGALEATLPLVNIAVRTGNAKSMAALMERVAASGPLPFRLQVFLNVGRAWDNIRQGNFAAVEEAVAAGVKMILASDDPADWNMPPLTPPLALGPSGPTWLESYYHGALRRLGHGPSPALAAAEQGSGYLALIRGRLDAAAASSARAAAMSEQLGGLAEIEAGILQTHYALAVIRGDPEAAERHIAERWPQIEQNALLRTWLPGYRYLIAKARWLAGRDRDAGEEAGRLAAGTDFPLVPQARRLLEGMLSTSVGRYDEAERALQEAIAFRPPYFTVIFWLDHPQIVLAHCYERWGRQREAIETLRPVLEECERLDTPGIILKVGPVVAPLLRLAIERRDHAPFAARVLHLLERAPVARS